jgi:hypothetical protein
MIAAFTRYVLARMVPAEQVVLQGTTRGPVLAGVIGPLAAGLGAPLNLRVNVAEPIEMEDGMSDDQHGSPESGGLSPEEGRPDASVV